MELEATNAFPLRKIPLLPREQIFRNMKKEALFFLSLTNRKLFADLTKCRYPSHTCKIFIGKKEARIECSDPEKEEEKEVWIVYPTSKYNADGNPPTSCHYDGIRFFWSTMNVDGPPVTVFYSDPPEKMVDLLVCQLKKIIPDTVDCQFDELSHRNLYLALRSGYLTIAHEVFIRQCEVSGLLLQRFFFFFHGNVHVLIEMPESQLEVDFGIKVDVVINVFSLYLSDALWFNRTHLLSMNVARATIDISAVTEHDIIKLCKEWIDGGHESLEVLQITLDTAKNLLKFMLDFPIHDEESEVLIDDRLFFEPGEVYILTSKNGRTAGITVDTERDMALFNVDDDDDDNADNDAEDDADYDDDDADADDDDDDTFVFKMAILKD